MAMLPWKGTYLHCAKAQDYWNVRKSGGKIPFPSLIFLSSKFPVDIFDGDNGEPQITHKRTFIAPISLRNVLNCIKAFFVKT
jgi:hypothetical protein